MNIDEAKVGVFPNIALEPGTPAEEVRPSESSATQAVTPTWGDVAALSFKLRKERMQREHWQRVASKHAARIRELKEQLATERALRAMLVADVLPEGVEWPRFEDGALVRWGDMFADNCGGRHECHGVLFTDPATVGLGSAIVVYGDRNGIGHNVYDGVALDYRPSHKLPRPPLLAADGLPIEAGQVLYGESDGKAWVVERFDRKREWSVWAHDAANPGRHKPLKPEWLAHERPDTWERIIEDAILRGYDEPHAEKDGYITKESLVARCKALAEGGAK